LINEPEIVKEIDLKEVRISLKSDGIVHVLLKANSVLDIELQMRMLDAYNVVTEKKLTPFIFEAEDGINVTKEARDNAILIEEISPCKAMAVVVDNIAYAMIGNFYLKFNKPKRPYKVFKNRKDGLDWLFQFL
jgi:hypothetical protein